MAVHGVNCGNLLEAYCSQRASSTPHYGAWKLIIGQSILMDFQGLWGSHSVLLKDRCPEEGVLLSLPTSGGGKGRNHSL